MQQYAETTSIAELLHNVDAVSGGPLERGCPASVATRFTYGLLLLSRDPDRNAAIRTQMPDISRQIQAFGASQVYVERDSVVYTHGGFCRVCAVHGGSVGPGACARLLLVFGVHRSSCFYVHILSVSCLDCCCCCSVGIFVLLLQREIRKLQEKVAQKGMTVVPLKIFFNDSNR